MSVAPKKPRHIYALQVVRQLLDDRDAFYTHFHIGSVIRNPDASPVTEPDRLFLRDFLARSNLRTCFDILDTITTGAGLQSLIARLRPNDPDEADSLRILSDVWTDLENFVMQTRETDEAEAHELYDLLADPHIREMLVAYDDIANQRYTVEDLEEDFVSLYSEPEIQVVQGFRAQYRGSSEHHLSKKSSDVAPQHEIHDDSLGEVTALSEEEEADRPGRNRGSEPEAENELTDSGDDIPFHMPPPPFPPSQTAELRPGSFSTSEKISKSKGLNGSVTHLVSRFEASAHSEPNMASSTHTQRPISKNPNPTLLASARSQSERKNLAKDDEDSWASIEPLTVLQQQPVKKDSMFASPVPDSHRRGSSTEPSSHHRSADLPSPTGSSIRASKASSKSSPTIPSPVHSPQSNRHLTHTGMRSPSHEITPSSPRSREIEADNSAHNSDYHAATLPAQQKRHVHTGSSARENSDMYHSGSQSLSRRTSRQSNRSTRRSDRESVDTTSTKVQLPEAGKTRVVRLRREHPGEPIGITITVRTPSPPPGGSGNQATSNNLLGTDASLTLQRLMSGSLSNKQGGSGTPTKSDLSFRTEPVLAIQRIMSGSLADRQGGLFPGDILLEFNGRPVHSLDEVYSQMRQSASLLECEFLVQAPHSNGFLRPGQQHNFRSSKSKRYIRSFFDYDAKVDSLMPAGDVGLSFKAGDVLELVDDQDPNFWQVRPLNDAHGRVRLIPSQTLEERRQAFNQEKAQLTAEGTKKKSKRTIKTFFRAADASDLRVRSDLWSYEEVVPWPESMVPCLLLLGAPGVGRRNLKALLVNREPNRFDFPKSDTTDPDASPVNFNVIPKEQMEKDVRSGAYVEWGKADGHYYGIKFSALRKIIATGRTVVLDCQPQSVYLLHQPEFNPVTIFVAAPHFEVAKRMMEDGLRAGLTQNRRSDEELRAMVEESQSLAVKHRHLYFHKFTNSDMKEGVEKLSRLVTRVERHPSWIPSGWAYEMSAPTGSDTGTPFVPGSSTLSALGIHTLPPSRPSAIARSVLSGISEASAESASRLARPPSILSESVTSQQGRATPANGKRLYERRRRPQVEFRPTAPTIPELDTPSESMTNRSRASENQPASGRPMGFSGTPTSPKPRNSPQVSERSNGSLRRHQHGSQSEQTDGTQPNQGLKAMDNLRTSQLGEGKDRHSQSLRDSRNSSESSNHRFPRTQANNRQSGSSLAPRRYDTSTTVPADEDISDTSSEDEGEMKDKEVHL